MPDWLSLDFWTKDSQSLNHLALIIAGVIGIPLLALRTFAANKSARAAVAQARTAEQGHITDRFTAAVEQLGSDKMAVRLGAIYALERISRDSRRDSWTITETLAAFVREHAPWPPRQGLGNPFVQWQASGADETTGETISGQEPKEGDKPPGAQIRPATDIQAALTVLGRQDRTPGRQDRTARRRYSTAGRLDEALGPRIDLAATDLRGADLWETHLEGADLRGAHLEGADLRGAVGLTREQLARAFGDAKTKVADALRPESWPAEAPDDNQ